MAEISPLAKLHITQQTFHLDTGVDIQFVEIPSGSFVMGSDTQIDRLSFDNELPPHNVDVNKYWMCKHPITNLLYKIFIDETHLPPPSNWMEGGIPQGLERHPVVFVNWFDASTFCEWLSRKINTPVCLPSEAEWEMAARLEYWPDSMEGWEEELFHLNVNYDRYYLFRGTTAVVQNTGAEDLQSGCADMLGNVWEWTSDWYDKNYYIKSPILNPIGPEGGVCRSIRGGSWADDYRDCRVQARQGFNPANRNSYTGFRCCISNTHANTYKNNSQIRFLLGKSIYQCNWSIADQLLDKWIEKYPEDPSIVQFQFQISQLKGKKQNQGQNEDLKIHSLKLQIASAIRDKIWEQVVSNSSELIKLTKYDKVAVDALLLAHQHLNQGKIKLLQSNLCILIEFRQKELVIEQLLLNKDWKNARNHVLELLPWSTIKTEITKKLEYIDTQIKLEQQKSILIDEAKETTSSKSGTATIGSW